MWILIKGHYLGHIFIFPFEIQRRLNETSTAGQDMSGHYLKRTTASLMRSRKWKQSGPSDCEFVTGGWLKIVMRKPFWRSDSPLGSFQNTWLEFSTPCSCLAALFDAFQLAAACVLCWALKQTFTSPVMKSSKWEFPTEQSIEWKTCSYLARNGGFLSHEKKKIPTQ